MKLKGGILIGFFVIILLINFASASYVQSNPQFVNTASTTSFFSSTPTQIVNFNSAMCQSGQDFIIQISPGGCQNTPVRSDLLSQSGARVYCPIEALKINPAVNIRSIVSMSFGESNLPSEVASVNFLPSRSALGINTQLNQPGWNQIGYAVINLKPIPNETAMPNYIAGNLSATITYNAYDAFGSVDRTVYLPVISDQQFSQNIGQYAFFNNMGYLRADSIQNNAASVSIYSDVNANTLENNIQKQKILNYPLKVGQSSPSFFLPGFGCFASSYLTLDSIQGQDTRAVIKVDKVTSELTKGQSFLNNSCQVTSDPLKQGLSESVGISCNTDQGGKSFTLRIEPTVNLTLVNEKTKQAETGQYKVGDWLYNNDSSGIYLGYVGTNSSGTSLKNMVIYLVNIPGKKGKPGDKLDSFTLEEVSKIADNSIRTNRNVGDITNFILGKLATSYSWLFKGENFQKIKYGQEVTFFKNKVSINGFGAGTNIAFNNQTIENYYQNAVKNYQLIRNNFKNEVYKDSSVFPTNDTMGALALQQLINLSSELYQREDLKKYCQEFQTYYPNSKLDISPCEGIPQYSNNGISSQTLQILGDYRKISFEGINVPDFNSYGIEVTVSKGNQVVPQPILLGKGDTVFLDPLFGSSNSTSPSTENYIRLDNIPDQMHATIFFNLQSKSTTQKIANFLAGNDRTITLNTATTIPGTDYTFTITKINLDKVAKVSVHTNIRDTTRAQFGFRIGIEKRSIQLSPAQVKSQINTFTKFNNKLESISKSLGGIVNATQLVCEGVGAVLTAKNLLFNLGTKSIARKQVMTGPGGWDSQCQSMTGPGKKYSTMDQCLLDHSTQIENEVNQVSQEMNNQNTNFNNLDKISGVTKSGGILDQNVVNQTALIKYYSTNVTDSLKSAWNNGCVSLSSQNYTTVLGALSPSGFGPYYSLDNAKQIELYSNLCSQNPQDSTYKTSLNSILQIVLNNYEKNNAKQSLAEHIGIPSSKFNVIQTKGAKELLYQGLTLGDAKSVSQAIEKDSGEPSTTPIGVVQATSGGKYIFLLDNTAGSTTYPILKDKNKNLMIYDATTGARVTDKTTLKELSVYYFQKVTVSNNPIKNPEIKYYENGQYKGLPSIVPVDQKTGWYAYIEQPAVSASISSGISSTNNYDASGRVNNFYLCNVGLNGIVEPLKGDDSCHLVELGNSNTYTAISGLTNPASMVNKAVNAISTASKAYAAGVQKVNIAGTIYKVGAPAAAAQTAQCTDIMSPSDCNILFNACDPVICPSSRCNFGGEYPVQNVIQSGLIGSIALCMPNSVAFGGSDYVPVCLTGVKAGIDNLAQTTQDYIGCLNKSLNTGQTTGICDEIYGVYGCELAWNTITPVANIAIPKIENIIYNGGTSGGGEYTGGIQAALNNAKEAANFITQSYAVSAFDAFKARSQGSVGTAVCKNALTQVFPQGQGMLDALSQAQSPPQFNGNFETIPYTTATNPPQVEYKVYYNIFAGNDAPANYQIYLKSSGSSYYQDTVMPIMIKSGVIATGGSEDNTTNFVGPQGYDQLCIQVNNQEKCGFGKVSTSFATNYLTDQYVKAEATTTNITTQSECISGTPNLYSLLTPNVEAGLTSVASPNINAAGITRVCASNNPGNNSDTHIGSTNQRWVQVGYCGNTNVKCWIDTQSIAGATNFQITANQTLADLQSKLVSQLKAQGGLFTTAQFQNLLTNVTDTSKSLQERINLIEKNYPKVFESSNKAYLKYLEAGDYGTLALNLFKELVKEKKISLPTQNGQGSGGTPTGTNQVPSNLKNCQPYFNNISSASKTYGISPEVLLGVIYQESRCNPSASYAGSIGIMQFDASTAYQYGLCSDKTCSGTDGRLDPAKSIDAGAKYLSTLLQDYSKYENSIQLTLAAYNGGPGVVNKAISKVPSSETVDWSTVSNNINSTLLSTISPYSSWTEAQRQNKATIIKNYVGNITNYIALFGSENLFTASGTPVSTQITTESAIKLLFKDGGITTPNLCFKYNSSGWFWRLNSCQDEYKQTTPQGDIHAKKIAVSNPWTSTSSPISINTLPSSDKNLITGLSKQGYSPGVQILINGVTSSSSSSGISGFWDSLKSDVGISASLSGENMTFDSKGIFTYTDPYRAYIPKLYFKYDKSSGWQWSIDNKVWQDSSTTSFSLDNTEKTTDPRDVTQTMSVAGQPLNLFSPLMSNFVQTLNGQNSQNGAAYLFNRGTLTTSGNSVSTQNTQNTQTTKTTQNTVKVNSSEYLFKGPNICFKYFDNSWHWKEGGCDYILPINDAKTSLYNNNPWTLTSSMSLSSLSSQDRSLISGLLNKNYKDGISYLLIQVSDSGIQSSNSLFTDAKIVSENATFNYNGIFTYSYLNFNFTSSGWEWSMDNSPWQSTSNQQFSIKGTSGSLGSYSPFFGDLVSTLGQKNYLDGAIYLFEGDSYPTGQAAQDNSNQISGPSTTQTNQNNYNTAPADATGVSSSY